MRELIARHRMTRLTDGYLDDGGATAGICTSCVHTRSRNCKTNSISERPLRAREELRSILGTRRVYVGALMTRTVGICHPPQLTLGLRPRRKLHGV